MTDKVEPRRFPWRQWKIWFERSGLTSRFAWFLTIAGLIAGVATYAALSEVPPFGDDPDTVYWLLNIDLVILLLLLVFVAQRMAGVLFVGRRGRAGARLHGQFVIIFSLLAALPAIILAIFSSLFLNLGVQSWFNERVSTAIDESVAVAEAYLEEHTHTIQADLLAMAKDINVDSMRLIGNPGAMDSLMRTQTILRDLNEAAIFDSQGSIVASGGLTFALEINPPDPSDFETARAGEIVMMTGAGDDRIRAMVRLDRFLDSYLVVGRAIDAQVLDHVTQTQEAAREYTILQGLRSDLQVTGTLIFIVVALVVLMASIWLGLVLADGLVRPIGMLIDTAERVGRGDLSARIRNTPARDELGKLVRAFNRMTGQLQSQQADLVAANSELDERRAFMETVLAGVSAGVCGMDDHGRIEIANKSAYTLLGVTAENLLGAALPEVVPEFKDLIARVSNAESHQIEDQIRVDVNGTIKTLLVRISQVQSDDGLSSYILTFDDISELMTAQRKAAWADVARRIAHEMKNPLTPIQLSAERLKRKYLSQVTQDPETFTSCTETIVRRVDDIRRMVDEFSAFARMPAPIMRSEDLGKILQDALVLYRESHTSIRFELKGDENPIIVQCDRQQMTQAISNLLQNAVDAIEGHEGHEGRASKRTKGEISIHIARKGKSAQILIGDDGCGLPAEGREHLTEPYVTTRQKGTGLGLAIVKKIMEDHQGRLELTDRAVRLDGTPWGALAIMSLPIEGAASADPPGSIDPSIKPSSPQAPSSAASEPSTTVTSPQGMEQKRHVA